MSARSVRFTGEWLTQVRNELPFLGLAIVACSPTIGTAQDVIRLDDVECPACTISLDRVGELGGGAERLWSVGSIALGAYGQVYVYMPADGRIALFDYQGRLLRSFGNPGDGPGEFSGRQTLAVDPNGQVHAFKSGGMRETVLDSALRTLLSTKRMPFSPFTKAPVGDGLLVAAQPLMGDTGSTETLHVLDSERNVLRSLDPQPAALSPFPFRRDALRRMVVTAGADAETFWVAHFQRYRIEHWHVDGRLLHVFERAPAWFQPWREYRSDERGASPFVDALVEDGQGRLWVTVRVADPDWARLVWPKHEGDGDPPPIDDRIDTIVEVIDIDRSIVLASHRFDRATPMESPGGAGRLPVFFRWTDDDVGFRHAELSRAVIHEPRR